MPTSTDGCVDDNSRWRVRDGLNNFFDHDWFVFVVLGHPQPLDRCHANTGETRAIRWEEGGGGYFHRTDRGTAHEPGLVRNYLFEGLVIGLSLCKACGSDATGPQMFVPSSIWSLANAAFSAYLPGDQSSTLSIAPITNTSSSNPAQLREAGGTGILP